MRSTLLACAAPFAAVAFFAVLPVAHADDAPPPSAVVTWELDKPYVIAGSGCTNGVDAFATANGNDFSVLFVNLGIGLEQGMPQLGDLRRCLMRIPLRMPRGFAPTLVTQALSYGFEKSAGAQAKLSVFTSVFSFGGVQHDLALPDGAWSDPFERFEADDTYDRATTPDAWTRWCEPNRSSEGLFAATLAMAGQKKSADDELVVFVDGFGLSYDVSITLGSC
jgi:hypothetical protein